MDRSHLLAIIRPMLTEFKREIEKMRKAGASQDEIDRMLDDFEGRYGSNAEGKLVMEVLRQAAKQPD
jgi:transcriptional regulator